MDGNFNGYNEPQQNENQENIEENEHIYKTVMEMKNQSRAWSVASLVVSIVSLLCCCLGWPGIVLGALAIVFSVLSRRNIGYFDGLSIAGLIVGIFGVVFSGSMLIFSYVVENSEFYEELLKELENSGYPEGIV